MSTFPVATYLPEKASILVVDPSLTEIEDLPESHKEHCLRKMEDMLKLLSSLKHRNDIYVTGKNLMPGFESIGTVLPFWFTPSHAPSDYYTPDPVNRALIEALKDKGPIFVCGLWEEWCVFAVVFGLNKAGLDVRLLRNNLLTLKDSDRFGFDNELVTLDLMCKENGLTLEEK